MNAHEGKHVGQTHHTGPGAADGGAAIFNRLNGTGHGNEMAVSFRGPDHVKWSPQAGNNFRRRQPAKTFTQGTPTAHGKKRKHTNNCNTEGHEQTLGGIDIGHGQKTAAGNIKDDDYSQKEHAD